MIFHLTTFVWRTDADSGEARELADELVQHARDYPTLRSYNAGFDLALRPGGADFGIVANCDTTADLMAYLNDPAHQEIVRRWGPRLVASKTSVQFESL